MGGWGRLSPNKSIAIDSSHGIVVNSTLEVDLEQGSHHLHIGCSSWQLEDRLRPFLRIFLTGLKNSSHYRIPKLTPMI